MGEGGAKSRNGQPTRFVQVPLDDVIPLKRPMTEATVAVYSFTHTFNNLTWLVIEPEASHVKLFHSALY